MTKTKRDIYQEITDKMIESLEAGTRPWTRSWDVTDQAGQAGLPPLRVTGEAYRGINVLILMMQGRGQQTWMTYRQASELGGQVRQGEKSTTITFFKILKKAQDDGTEKKIPLLRAYAVFNVEQIDSLPDRFYQTHEPVEPRTNDRDDEIDAWVDATGAQIGNGGGRAYYAPGPDTITMPSFDQFHSGDAYYATVLHELAHWTGHRSRLDRLEERGREGYAREELVAELSATFLCATLGIHDEPRDDHAQYLAAWLRVLKDDKKAIFQAATKAQAAADLLHNLVEQATVSKAA